MGLPDCGSNFMVMIFTEEEEDGDKWGGVKSGHAPWFCDRFSRGCGLADL